MKTKKILCLLLAVTVILLSFAGCKKSGNEPPKSMLEKATEIEMEQLNQDVFESELSAREKHVGKTYITTGFVGKTDENYIYISYTYENLDYLVKAEFKDMTSVIDYKLGDVITFIGEVKDVGFEDRKLGEHNINRQFVLMEKAYVLDTDLSQFFDDIHDYDNIKYIAKYKDSFKQIVGDELTNTIVGKWDTERFNQMDNTQDKYIYEFASDGSAVFSSHQSISMSWKVENDEIVVTEIQRYYNKPVIYNFQLRDVGDGQYILFQVENDSLAPYCLMKKAA